MEEHLATKFDDPEFSIINDFDWTSQRIEHVSLMMFGGFYTDAKENDKEPFTLEKAESITSMVGIAQARGIIEQSLSRAMSPEQYKKCRWKPKEKSGAASSPGEKGEKSRLDFLKFGRFAGTILASFRMLIFGV